MDDKGVNSLRPKDGENGQVIPSVGYKRNNHFTGREKVMLFFSTVLALCTITLIIGLVVKLEMKTDCPSETVVPVSQNGQSATQSPAKGPCTSRACVQESAALINAIDFDVDPCDNFYEFSCGNWKRSRTIPDDKSAYKRFTEVRDKVQLKLKVVLEKPITGADITAVRMVKTVYKSCIDEAMISQKGMHVIDPLLRELGGWPVADTNWDESSFNLEELMVKLGLYNNMIIAEPSVVPDDKNSSVYTILIDQASLGMPSRSYYLNSRDDERLTVYQNMARDIAVAFGADKQRAETEMSEMVDFEILIANMTLAQADRRDMDKLYHRMTVGELQTSIPGLDWLKYLKGLFGPFNHTITDSEYVVVYTPDYLRSAIALTKTTSKRTLANYLVWRIMLNRVNNLAEEYRDLKKDYNRVVFGKKRDPPKWALCVDYVNENLGDAVGRIFIDNYFDRVAKENAMTMIRYLRESFENLLRKATWMDEETRTFALDKATGILEKIGYPEYMLNDTRLNEEYDDVSFNDTTYFANVLTVLRDRVRDQFWYLHKTVDRSEWTTTPAVVNAFYSPNLNSISFPAAILQPPFYSKEYPMSLVFGGIGMVIGHEITHGFDDEGRQFDKVGNFYQWWTNSSLTKFTDLANCLVDQYSSFEMNGDHVNGKMTLGENMADNGGIKASFEAYRKWVQENGEEQLFPGLDLTHEQLFFINFAQGWCALSTDAGLHNQILTDTHSPSTVRVVGTVSNSEYFQDAFHCAKGSKMNPAKKCAVW